MAHKLYHLKAGTPALSGQGKRSGEQSAPMSATVRRSVSDINRLLKELFGRPTYLSGLLAQAGLSQNDIACLRDNHLDQYLERLMLHWIAWWETLLLPISVTVLRKHYDRLSSWSEADRKRLIRHSVQQRRRALAAALAKLRLDMNRQKLAEIAIVEARAILDGEGPQTRSKHVSQ
ncbi:MAG: hypothetical protein R3300_02950 [Candidatus Promineifilaceae bacterium]|nr:hypothetical protein [Candidatus Promineifilaceae bacterium]